MKSGICFNDSSITLTKPNEIRYTIPGLSTRYTHKIPTLIKDERSVHGTDPSPARFSKVHGDGPKAPKAYAHAHAQKSQKNQLCWLFAFVKYKECKLEARLSAHKGTRAPPVHHGTSGHRRPGPRHRAHRIPRQRKDDTAQPQCVCVCVCVSVCMCVCVCVCMCVWVCLLLILTLYFCTCSPHGNARQEDSDHRERVWRHSHR